MFKALTASIKKLIKYSSNHLYFQVKAVNAIM